MSTPTIKDVAKLAGVSISTVSRVMNNSKPVSPESRRKVEDAIKKLDFKRNELARSLVMKRSNLIGVLVKDLGIPYMAQIVRGVEEIGRMYKYDMLLNSSYGDSEQEKLIIDFMLRKQAEAIVIITENTNPELIFKMKENNNNFILLDKYYRGEYNTVTIDYELASEKMTNHLIEMGHKKIIFVSQDEETSLINFKEQGYLKTMKENGLETKIIKVDTSEFNEGYKIGPEIEKLYEEGFTCAYAFQDNVALSLINYLQNKDISVPEDFSVAGFSDISISKDYEPSLTTIHEPNYDIGAVAMRRIVKKLREEEEIKENIYLPVQLLKRDSIKDLNK